MRGALNEVPSLATSSGLRARSRWACQICTGKRCCDSLLYKGSEDDNELELEVTSWAWNKRTRTKTIMTAMRMRVKGSMVAVRLRLWGVDKRTV
jgi:hypothetical protein